MLDYKFFYIISIPLYIIFLVFLIYKKVNIKKIVLYSLFYFYIIALITVTIFPIPIQGLKEVGKYFGSNNNNFIPFVSILDILLKENLSLFIKTKQVLGNIILFIPMWFFIKLICDKINFKKSLLIGIFISFSIELLQFIISRFLWFNYKVTDIDDIILNSLWFIIGLFLYRVFYRWFIKN